MTFITWDDTDTLVGFVEIDTFPKYVYTHVAFTYDGTSASDAVKAYKDGVLVETSSGTGNDISNQVVGDLIIGATQAGIGNFNGTLDELSIWNRELLGTEILAHYQRGRTDDSTTNENDGQIEGPHQVDGIIGEALQFNGINDSVVITDSTSLSFTNDDMTISAWIKLNSRQSGERAIVRKSAQWQLGILPLDNKIRNLVNTDGTTGWTAANDEYHIWEKNIWYHLAFTYDGSVLKHYVNGEQIGTDKTVTGNIIDNNQEVAIGADSPDGGLDIRFDGAIDEVAIWNRTLSSAEIQKLYYNGFRGPDGTPATYYNDSTGYALNLPDSQYFQYRAYLSSPDGNHTSYLQKVFANYTAIVTDSSGDYNYSFTAPASEGTYPVKVNATFWGIYGENEKNLTVDDYIVIGGSGTTCTASSSCVMIKDSGGSVKARFDQGGNLDLKGEYWYNNPGELIPSAESFEVKDDGGTTTLYINNTGSLFSLGKFQKQSAPTTSGGGHMIFKNDTGDIVGYINSTSGNMYFRGDLHYKSDF
jgi:hypothetical protein